MSILIITIIAIIILYWGTKHSVSRHPLYGKIDLEYTKPRGFLLVTILMFAATCVYYSIINLIDSLRDVNGWVNLIGGGDPVIQEVMSIMNYSSDNGVSFGSERTDLPPDVALLFSNVTSGYHIVMLCLIVSVIAYILYIRNLRKPNRNLLRACYIIIGFCMVVSIIFACTGFDHIVYGLTAGPNQYTGDMSGSILWKLFGFIGLFIVVKSIKPTFSKFDTLISTMQGGTNTMHFSTPTQPQQSAEKHTIKKTVEQNRAKANEESLSGKDAATTKTCPYCGEQIPIHAIKCKWCGETLPVEKKKMQCPICGELVDEGTKVCPYCHEDISNL